MLASNTPHTLSITTAALTRRRRGGSDSAMYGRLARERSLRVAGAALRAAAAADEVAVRCVSSRGVTRALTRSAAFVAKDARSAGCGAWALTFGKLTRG